MKKLYISADIEGVACISAPVEVDKAHPAEYQPVRDQMTAEVAAACAGAFDAGVESIVVKDGRGELVVLDADPLADITATRRIHAVLARRHLMRAGHLQATAQRVRAAFDAMPPVVVELPGQHEYLAKGD